MHNLGLLGIYTTFYLQKYAHNLFWSILPVVVGVALELRCNFGLR